MWNKYLALLRRGLGLMLEYRVSVLIWMLTMSMPLIMLAVWLSLAQDGPVGHYSAADFVTYYVLVLYVRQMTVVWVVFELDNDIRHGQLAIKLLHPLNPVHEYISNNLADKALRLLVLTPLIIIPLLIIPGVRLTLEPLNVGMFILMLAAAWYLRFIQQYTTGLLAFWISQATTIQDAFFLFFQLFGGVVAPLDLLPGWLATAGTYLPFRYMLSFPVEILLGRLSGQELALGLAICLGWIAFFHLLYLWVWRRGLRTFSAYGA